MGRGQARTSQASPRAAPGRPDPAPAAQPADGLPDWVLAVVVCALGTTLLDGGGLKGAAGIVAVSALVLCGAAVIRTRAMNRDEWMLVATATAFALVWITAAVGWGSGLSGARGLAAAAASLPATLLLARRLSPPQAASAARWLVRGAAVIAALALIGYLQRVPVWAYASTGGSRAAGTLGYPNAFGLLLTLVVPLAAVELRRAGTEADRRWARAAVFLAVAALAATMSRGGAAALLVALVALEPPVRRQALAVVGAGGLAALPLVGSATSDSPNVLLVAPLLVGLGAVVAAPPAERVRRIAVAGAAAVTIAILTTPVASVASDRLAWSNLDARSPEWTAAVEQLVSAPLLGVGPERAVVVSDPRDGHEYWSRFVHSEPLQVAGGAGLVGAALLGLFGHRIARLLRSKRGAHAIATALAFALGGAVDFSWHFAAIPMVAGLLLGLNPPESENR